MQEKGIEPELILYLKNPPSFEELSEVIDKLGINPLDLIRKKESIFKENFKGKDLSDKEWIKAMVDHPKLIERPILISENRAVIGRPKENVLQLID